jgi:glyoxylase-like metal-dependent hydrolase (beta-lactamase superfamily II)
MGGSSVLITDAGPYMKSLRRVANLKLTRLYPGHGDQIDRPSQAIAWYIAHRQEREMEILEAVTSGCRTVGEVVEQVYDSVNINLHNLAAYSVAAHLKKLAAEGTVRFEGGPSMETPVEPTSES